MKPLVIAGPTASGKSALALAVAERDGGCVINADALQVYACWRVLTARPDATDLARAPHRLYGHVPCDASYSVGAWLRDVEVEISAATRRGERPVVVGGTGLYLTALTAGFADIPPVPAAVRQRSEALLRAGRDDVLRADLARDDPETLAEIDARNPKRLQRAWEVQAATGRGLASWRRAQGRATLPQEASDRIVLETDNSFLNNIISARFRTMVDSGALEEVAAFRASGHDLDRPSGRALGAAELSGYLDGRIGLEAAIDAAVIATRRYAKRQRTWFRNQMPDWTRLDPTVFSLSDIARG